MASHPSLYSEERNLLRIQAWEQRNQETSHEKKLNPENAPLFGKPHKTSKWDVLSCRIQKILGSYEDDHNPDLNSSNFVKDLLSTSKDADVSQLDHSQSAPASKSNSPPFHNNTPCTSTNIQTKSCSSSTFCSQPLPTSDVLYHQGAVTGSRPSSDHDQERQSRASPQQQDGEDFLDMMEFTSLPELLTSLSPEAGTQASLHSSNCDDPEAQHTENNFEKHQHQGSSDHIAVSPSKAVEVTQSDPQKPPKDLYLPQAIKPPQTFPPLLASKTAGLQITQKPTAYVRPMDGQDQVVSESPELKPSPEPYEPLQDKINNKSHLEKLKILPQFLETRSNEGRCVEDILREMTHTWPPLLTKIETPSTAVPSKSSFTAKVWQTCQPARILVTNYTVLNQNTPEAEKVQPTHPEGKNYDCPPTAPSYNNQQSSAFMVEATHSSGVESASSSDSESSSGTESDNEGSKQEPPQSLRDSPPQIKMDVPPATHSDWQLVNWIRSSQQNSTTESHCDVLVSNSPACKRLLSSPSPRPANGEVTKPARVFKSHVSTLQELSDNHAETRQGHENPPRFCNDQRSHKPHNTNSSDANSGGHGKTVHNWHASKQAQALNPKNRHAPSQVETERAVDTLEGTPSFSDGPKVKKKAAHSKSRRGGSDAKKDCKTAAKTTSVDKQKGKTRPKVAPVLSGQCPSYHVDSPNLCIHPIPSPKPEHAESPAPPVEVTGVKVKAQNASQKVHKNPRKNVRPSAKPAPSATSLWVKIDLSLLPRVPPVPVVHFLEEISGVSKRVTLGPDAVRNHQKKSTSTKKNKTRPAEMDKKPPRKKQKMEKPTKVIPPSRASTNFESSTDLTAGEKKKAKKPPVAWQEPPVARVPTKASGKKRSVSSETKESGLDAQHGGGSSTKHKRSAERHAQRSKTGMKAPKSSFAIPPSVEPARGATPTRPLLRIDDRRYPVKHYIKEAKKLKHKADAEPDKVSKGYDYLDAAMFFVESGVAMEMDPQTSKSSYSMFEDTVDLIKFVLKLKNWKEPSPQPSENDFIVLCMKCQSFLQMAMFRCKHKLASKYSKTLNNHFKNSAKPARDPCLSADAPSPGPDTPSPAGAGGSHHGPAGGPAKGPAGGTVAIPKLIHQITFTYVNITALFLSSQDAWEQAEQLARRGSGLQSELERAMGPLSLTSSMSSLVRYTRQALHWLRLESQNVK